MDGETIEKFLPEIQSTHECGTGRKNDGLFLRYCRKKFKCIIIFMLLGIAMCQTSALILKTLDFDELVASFVNTSITTSNEQKLNVGELIDKVFKGNQEKSELIKHLDVLKEDGNTTMGILTKLLKELTYDSPFDG